MSTTVFEYVVFLKPTKNEEKNGERPKIIVPLTQCVADSEQEVRTIAARAIPEEHVKATDRIQVLVRPFCPSR